MTTFITFWIHVLMSDVTTISFFRLPKGILSYYVNIIPYNTPTIFLVHLGILNRVFQQVRDYFRLISCL